MEKVSIIMPSYNSEKYIKQAVKSVIKQTYLNWELIIVDDCSTDNTRKILKNLSLEEKRLIVIELDANKGAANARNKGIEYASGNYIAFLDSDDLWVENKLDNQIKFMKKNNVLFCCTFYDKIDSNSKSMENIIEYPEMADYESLLRFCPGNSTVIYNSSSVGKVFVPDIKKRNDYLMWLSLIKKAGKLYCLPEVLSSHRVHSQGLSSNKKSLIKYHWYIYRKIENLSYLKSIYLVFFWIKKSLIGTRSVYKNIIN